MTHENHPDYFPELRFHTLESYAHKWAEAKDEDYNFDLRYPFINRIILYRIPVAYGYNKKYLLFFELSEIIDEREKIFPQLLESPGWLINCFGDSENNFREIYKKEPDQNYLNEWVIVTKRPKDVVKKHSWILFSRSDKEKVIKENLNGFTTKEIDLIKKARPEIEAVYKTIKEGEGFNELGEKYDNARMEDALYYFEENEDKFKIIKKEDLQNEEIYKTYTSQHARTFKGKLLQTIIKKHGMGKHSHSNLFREYQKQKKIKL